MTEDGAAYKAVDMTRKAVCGGIAGMIAKTATNPLERIKMLSQTGEHGLSNTQKQSIMSLYRNIIQNEGILGLWAGNGANLLRVFPAKSVVFSCNDAYRNILRKYTTAGSRTNGKGDSQNTNQNNHNTMTQQQLQPLPGHLEFLAGGLAGMTATTMTYPLDLARGRISGKLKGKDASTRHYKGIINTIVITMREEGFKALYKGVTPTVLGAMPYEGIKFGTVGILEKAFPWKASLDEHGDLHKPSVFRKVVFGGAGGIMAGLITYPNDTVRRMLQLQGSRGTTETYSGYWDCVRKVCKKHGVGRLYHGVGINIIRMAPNTAVQFGSYELLKRLSDGYL